MEPVSRSSAKQSGDKYYFTGTLCKNGHTSKRSVSNCACYQCELDKSAKFRQANPDYHHNYNKQYYPENKKLTKKHSDAYYARQKAEQPEALKKRQELAHKEYRSRQSARIKQRGQVWRQLNKGVMNAMTAKRRSAKLRATPLWSDLKAIREIYEMCEQINTMTKMFGGITGFVVDHIVPLQGKTVCGLHIPSNLRIITAHENATKLNKLQEEIL